MSLIFAGVILRHRALGRLLRLLPLVLAAQVIPRQVVDSVV